MYPSLFSVAMVVAHTGFIRSSNFLMIDDKRHAGLEIR